MNKIKMKVAQISVDKSDEPILVLIDETIQRALPIWIGVPEATAIGLAASKVKSSRPLMCDVFVSAINQMGYKIEECFIHEIDNGVFKARLLLAPKDTREDTRTVILDARPSDAITIAIKSSAPVYVAEEVLSEAGMHIDDTEGPDSSAVLEDDREFKEFLLTIKPSDFAAFVQRRVVEEGSHDNAEIVELKEE